MAVEGLKEAIAANLDWLRAIRLADRIEWVWLGVPAAFSLVVLAACLAFTRTPVANSLIGATAHLCFVLCLYFSAPRNRLLPLSLVVFLSELNLLIYIWNAAPKPGVVLVTYGVLAGIAAVISTVVYRAALRRLALLHSASTKDDFRWLVAAAPLSLRHQARRIVRSFPERKAE